MNKYFQEETAGQKAKRFGLASLNLVRDTSGVGLVTLSNWHMNKPKLFEIVLLGCVQKLKEEN